MTAGAVVGNAPVTTPLVVFQQLIVVPLTAEVPRNAPIAAELAVKVCALSLNEVVEVVCRTTQSQ